MYNKKVLSDAMKNLNKVKVRVKKQAPIVDPMGQWNHPGEVTIVPGRHITMSPDPRTGEPLKQPLLGISDKGEKQIMFPGGEYVFKKGTKYVEEQPLAKGGGSLNKFLPKAQIGGLGIFGEATSRGLGWAGGLSSAFNSGLPFGGFNFEPPKRTYELDKMTKRLLDDNLLEGFTYDRLGDMSNYLGDFNFKSGSPGDISTIELKGAAVPPEPLLSMSDFITRKQSDLDKILMKYKSNDDITQAFTEAESKGYSAEDILLRVMENMVFRTNPNLKSKRPIGSEPFFLPDPHLTQYQINRHAINNPNFGNYQPFGKQLNESPLMQGATPFESFGDDYYMSQIKKTEQLLSDFPNASPEIKAKLQERLKDLYSHQIQKGMSKYDFDQNLPSDIFHTSPNKYGGLVKAQEGGATSPEQWEQEIRAIEKQIGNPSGWTMEDYYLLQDKLNAYRDWRENTPEGQAVVDYHNEEGEYDVQLPEHLQDYTNAMMKARLAYANEFGNPAAQRMITMPDNLYDFGDGNMGSHYMASMDNYAVPQIQDENGQLNLGDYGVSSREAMQFDNPNDARYFAEHYKDVSPGFIQAELSQEEIDEYVKGGYIVEELPKAQKGQSIPHIQFDPNTVFGKLHTDDQGITYDENGDIIEAPNQSSIVYDKRGNVITGKVPEYGTIYVSDPNDPRIEEYKKRKELYNLSKKAYLKEQTALMKEHLEREKRELEKQLALPIGHPRRDPDKYINLAKEEIKELERELANLDYIEEYKGNHFNRMPNVNIDDVTFSGTGEHSYGGKYGDIDFGVKGNIHGGGGKGDRMGSSYYNILKKGIEEYGILPQRYKRGEGWMTPVYTYPSLTVRYADPEKYEWAKPVEPEIEMPTRIEPIPLSEVTKSLELLPSTIPAREVASLPFGVAYSPGEESFLRKLNPKWGKMKKDDYWYRTQSDKTSEGSSRRDEMLRERGYQVNPFTGRYELPKAQVGTIGTKAGELITNTPKVINSIVRTYDKFKPLYDFGKAAFLNDLSSAPWMQENLDILRNIDITGFPERMNFVQGLQDINLIGPDLTTMDQFRAAANDDFTNLLTKLAIEQDLTGYRQVKPQLQWRAHKHGAGGLRPEQLTEEEINRQRNAMIEAGVDLNDPKSVSAYFATHIPLYQYGWREGGLENLPAGTDAIYLSARPEKYNPDYGPHMWRVRQPFDFSTGNYMDWLAKHYFSKNPLRISGEFNPLLGVNSSGVPSTMVFSDTGNTGANVSMSETGIGHGLNTRRWASHRGVPVAEPDFNPDNPFPAFYDYTKLTPEEKRLIEAEQRAVDLGWKTGFRDEMIKYQSGIPVRNLSEISANISGNSETNLLNADIDRSPEYIEKLKSANESFIKLLEDSQKDKLARWQTPEGQKRLQNMIDSTPILSESGVVPQDYIDAVAGLDSPNRTLLRELNQVMSDLETAGQYERMIMLIEDTGMGAENLQHYQTQVDYYHNKALNTIENSDVYNILNRKGDYNAYHEIKYPEPKKITTGELDLRKDKRSPDKITGHATGFGEGTLLEESIPSLKQLIEHEFGHLLQKGFKTNLDLVLENLKLKSDDLFTEAVRENKILSNDGDIPKRKRLKDPHRFSKDKIYYETGSKGKEKLPFALEVRERMLQNGIIDDVYDNISPTKIKQYYNQYMKSERDFELRLFEIMENADSNFDILSWVLNRAPSVLLTGTVGESIMNSDETQDDPQKFKLGGSVGLGDVVDEATMQRLVKQGYIFEKL